MHLFYTTGHTVGYFHVITTLECVPSFNRKGQIVAAAESLSTPLLPKHTHLHSVCQRPLHSGLRERGKIAAEKNVESGSSAVK